VTRQSPRCLLAATLLAIAASLAFAAARKGSNPIPKAALSVKASPTVRHWLKGMTLRDEVAQLIFIAFHG
jgi:Spy/CpxP family protein refolding chaperone